MFVVKLCLAPLRSSLLAPRSSRSLRQNPQLPEAVHNVCVHLRVKPVRLVDQFTPGVLDQIVEPLVALERVDLAPLRLAQRSEDGAQVVLVQHTVVGLPQLQHPEDVLVRLHGGNVLG